MGLFGKSKQEIAFMERQVPALNKQFLESVDLLDKTVKPDVFFSRYDFMLETLTRLAVMEKHIKFKSEKPSLTLKKLSSPSVREEQTASFILRAYEKMLADAVKLKTAKAKQSKAEKFFSEMAQYGKYLSQSNLGLLDTLRQQSSGVLQ